MCCCGCGYWIAMLERERLDAEARGVPFDIVSEPVRETATGIFARLSDGAWQMLLPFARRCRHKEAR